jgi:hypothetical protein
MNYIRAIALLTLPITLYAGHTQSTERPNALIISAKITAHELQKTQIPVFHDEGGTISFAGHAPTGTELIETACTANCKLVKTKGKYQEQNGGVVTQWSWNNKYHTLELMLTKITKSDVTAECTITDVRNQHSRTVHHCIPLIAGFNRISTINNFQDDAGEDISLTITTSVPE